MDKKQIQGILRTIFILTFGLFDLLLIIRFLLKLIGAGESSSFVAAWYNISNAVYAPFLGTINNLELGKLTIEVNSIVGAIVYLITGFLSFRMVGSIFADTMSSKVQQFVDTFFKMIEAALGMRLIFKLIAVGSSGFVSFLYGISSIFSSPFEGILKEVVFRNFVFETSTFVAIFLIIIIDILSDKILAMVVKETPARVKATQANVYQQQAPPPSAPATPVHTTSANISSLPFAGGPVQATPVVVSQPAPQPVVVAAPQQSVPYAPPQVQQQTMAPPPQQMQQQPQPQTQQQPQQQINIMTPPQTQPVQTQEVNPEATQETQTQTPGLDSTQTTPQQEDQSQDQTGNLETPKETSKQSEDQTAPQPTTEPTTPTANQPVTIYRAPALDDQNPTT